jgi:hypothetical protein
MGVQSEDTSFTQEVTCNLTDHFQLSCSLVACYVFNGKSRIYCFKNIAKKKT